MSNNSICAILAVLNLSVVRTLKAKQFNYCIAIRWKTCHNTDLRIFNMRTKDD